MNTYNLLKTRLIAFTVVVVTSVAAVYADTKSTDTSNEMAKQTNSSSVNSQIAGK